MRKESSRQQEQLEQKPRCRKAQAMMANVSHSGFLQLGSICETKSSRKNVNISQTSEELGGH